MPSSITAAEFIARGTRVIDIPGFAADEEPIQVTVKAMSLTKVMLGGHIPNAVLASVKEVFGEVKKSQSDTSSNESLVDTLSHDPDSLKNFNEMLDAVCSASMLKPKFEEVREYMTDDQKMTIFNFVSGGVKALADFRKDPPVHGNGDGGSVVAMPTLGNSQA